MRSLHLLALIGMSVGVFGTSQATAQQPAANQPVHMKFQVPADAQVWLNGAATTMQGPVRDFLSPALKPGEIYVYDVRVRWQRYGQTIDQTRELTVRAGDFVVMNFQGSEGGYTSTPVVSYGQRAYYAPTPEALSYNSSALYGSDLRRGGRIGWAARQTGILSYYGATPGWGTVDSTGLR